MQHRKQPVRRLRTSPPSMENPRTEASTMPHLPLIATHGSVMVTLDELDTRSPAQVLRTATSRLRASPSTRSCMPISSSQAAARSHPRWAAARGRC
jgi:hypothetical protein